MSGIQLKMLSTKRSTWGKKKPLKILSYFVIWTHLFIHLQIVYLNAS